MCCHFDNYYGDIICCDCGPFMMSVLSNNDISFMKVLVYIMGTPCFSTCAPAPSLSHDKLS